MSETKINEIKNIPKLPIRKKDSHKGDFGKVFVIAGSLGMTGAAILCGSAAQKIGAGLVYMGVPQSLMSIIELKMINCITIPLPETSNYTLSKSAERPILNQIRSSDIVAIGPGLSRSPQTTGLVLSILHKINKPMIIDADGLNIISDKIPILKSFKTPVILTPHTGEMARLIKKDVSYVINNREKVAIDFVKKYKITLVLKGMGTIVASENNVYHNKTGNPGMATAGSGDVLTGIIAGLFAQGFDSFQASQLGVYLHGLAGDIAAEHLTEYSMNAEDIINYIPYAIKKHLN